MATFIVEDGTGLENANAYVDTAYVDSYNDDHSEVAAWTVLLTAAKEKHVRLATQYLDATYLNEWAGVRLRPEQRLAWPRFSVIDDDGFLVESDSVPWQVEQATAEMAIRSASGDILIPDLSTPGSIAAESVTVGPISTSTTYLGGKSQIKQYRLVEELLAALTSGSSGVLERA